MLSKEAREAAIRMINNSGCVLSLQIQQEIESIIQKSYKDEYEVKKQNKQASRSTLN